MFNTYVIGASGSDIRNAAHIVAKSNKDLGNKLDDISKAEIKSKDRVDITLEEYLRMKNTIELLENKVARMGSTITALGIPHEMVDAIDPDSIVFMYNDCVRDFKCHCRVEFAVNDSPDIREWRRSRVFG